MSSSCVKALLISSLDSEFQRISELISQIEHCNITLDVVEQCPEAQERLKRERYDILLISTDSDFDQRMSLVRWSHDEEHSEPSAIILTHKNDHSLYQLALQSGAFDSICIEMLTPMLLERSIRYAIRQKADEIRLLKLAHYDPLTGIANRLLFKNRLDVLMSQSRRADQLLALMMIDLDHFKQVNDKLGHDAGDDLLIKVAGRLQNSIRETDTVARLGGDEFAIIATQLNNVDDAATMAQAILQACRFTVNEESEPFEVSCSIGIALYPHDGNDFSHILKQADMALLKTKKISRSTFLFADQPLNRLTQQRQQFNNDLNRALQRDQLELYFQPVISVKDQRITGTEALLRWQHPGKGILKPCDFLPIAEANGLINTIGSWVVHRVCEQHLLWRSQGLPPIPIAINLSTLQLEQQQLMNAIYQLINKAGFDLSYLTMELSETDAFRCSAEAIDVLFELHELGVNLTIDNFGKEYCSLNKLHTLPVDAVKIDRSLIQRLNVDSEYTDVIEAVIQLCKIMNLDVIAQGVENADSLNYLNKHQCQQAQGHFISSPMSGDTFPAWYNQYNQNLHSYFH